MLLPQQPAEVPLVVLPHLRVELGAVGPHKPWAVQQYALPYLLLEPPVLRQVAGPLEAGRVHCAVPGLVRVQLRARTGALAARLYCWSANVWVRVLGGWGWGGGPVQVCGWKGGEAVGGGRCGEG
jgi:hypothetical protein